MTTSTLASLAVSTSRPSPRTGLFSEIGLLTARRTKEMLRQPVWLISGALTPVLYLVLFAPLLTNLPLSSLGGTSVVQMFLPGMLVLFAFGSGTGIGWTIVHELDTGVIERFRVSPVRRVSLLLGSVIRDALMFCVCAIIVSAIAVPFGFEIHVAGLALCLLLLAILTGMVSAFSAAIGLTLKSIGGIAAVITGLQLPITLLAGALLPISLAPTWLRLLAHLNPLYYGVEAARDLAAGRIGTSAVGLGCAVTLGLFAVTVAWATRVFRRAVA
jgi:ABC-2 type transport system permease protein